MIPVHTEQGLARHRCPEPVAGGERRDVVVGPAGPADAAVDERAERIEPQRTGLSEVAGVGVADPPHERGRGLGEGGVVGALQLGDGVERVVGGDVGVDDAVSQARARVGLQRERVAVDHPVDALIADGVHADVQPGVVEQADLLPQ